MLSSSNDTTTASPRGKGHRAPLNEHDISLIVAQVFKALKDSDKDSSEDLPPAGN